MAVEKGKNQKTGNAKTGRNKTKWHMVLAALIGI